MALISLSQAATHPPSVSTSHTSRTLPPFLNDGNQFSQEIRTPMTSGASSPGIISSHLNHRQKQKDFCPLVPSPRNPTESPPHSCLLRSAPQFLLLTPCFLGRRGRRWRQRWWAGGSTRGMFWLGAAHRIGNRVGPLDKTLLFVPPHHLPVFWGEGVVPASGTMKKEAISSLKLHVRAGNFLSFPVFQPTRGLRDSAFIGQVFQRLPHPPAGSSRCHFNHCCSILRSISPPPP